MRDDRRRKPRALRQFDRLIGDLNVLLSVFALCLAVLDTTVFVTLFLSDEILGRLHAGAPSAVDAALTAEHETDAVHCKRCGALLIINATASTP